MRAGSGSFALPRAGRRLRRHPPAFIRATPAGLRALLAVIHAEPGALVCTCTANFSAHLANLGSKGAAPGHERRCRSANLGAIHIQTDAVRHAIGILLLQAGYGTVVTDHGALVTGFNTRLKRLMRHGASPFQCGTIATGEVWSSASAVTSRKPNPHRHRTNLSVVRLGSI